MKSKLTLRMDADLIESAKRFAHGSGKSVSQLVADYFLLLEMDRTAAREPPQPGPIVASLRGSLGGADVDETDYRRYLEEKHL